MDELQYKINHQCIGCGKCLRVCKVQAITSGSPFVIDPKRCTQCGICAKYCPRNAIQKIRRENKMYACIDMGGTSIKVAMSDELGDLVDKTSLPVHEEFDGLIDIIVTWVKQMQEKYEIQGIAISAPGAVNSETGIIDGASAIPCIHGPNWKETILEKTGLPCSVENDANCAALAEVFSGTAKDVKDMMFVVVGSGIGGAVVKDGKIHKGNSLYGGEFGYMLMDYKKGKAVILSEVASTMSFVRKVRAHYQDDSFDGVKVFQQASNGDQVCINAIDSFYENLARGIFTLQHVYDPQMILLGGAISQREDFIERINEKIEQIKVDIHMNCAAFDVRTCTHQADANLIGALAHHLKEYETK